MLFIKEIVENIEKWQESCKRRNSKNYLDQIIQLEQNRKKLERDFQLLSYKRRQTQFLKDDAQNFRQLSQQIKEIKKEKINIQNQLEVIYNNLPNWLDASVPNGNSEISNQILYIHGQQKHGTFLHDKCKQYHKTYASEITGAKFALFTDELAQLERGLNNFLLTFFQKRGFKFCSVPTIANFSSMYNAGKLPKFQEDMFHVDSLYLIPTGEVPLVNLLKYFDNDLVTITQCFRKEAGASGSKHYGWIRQHEFSKVELVAKTTNPKEKFQQFCEHQEELLTHLGLTWRKVNLCAGDIGITAYKQIDYEVWLTGYQKWLEVCSISDCRFYQSARMQLKKNKEYLYTLNATGGAATRLMAALIETYHENSLITLPSILHSTCPKEFRVA